MSEEDGVSSCDLLVVGSGAAGLTGALFAALGGARVMVLEKTDLIGGTTSMSGGGIWIPNNHIMASVGVTDSREEALTYLRACTQGQADDAHLVALVEHGAEMVRRLEADVGFQFQAWPPIGGMIDYRPWLPGAKYGGRNLEAMGVSMSELGPWAARLRKEPRLRSATNMLDYYTKKMHLMTPSDMAAARADDRDGDVYWHGTALAARLLQACLRHGVDVRTGAHVEQLCLEEGRVTGARAGIAGQSISFRAPHLLMATGGYANNEELKRLWLNRPLDYTCEISANQGDGHLMGVAVGAQLAGLGDAWWLPHIPLGEENGVRNLAGTREDRILPHTLIVNSAARRFVNEATNYYDFGEAFGLKNGAGVRNFPAWFIFDRQGFERYGLLAFKVPRGDCPAWLHIANSVSGLARSIGVDPGALANTIDRFNGFARSGVDEDFHRGENAWDRAWGDPDTKPNPSLGTVEKAPFYALPVYPGANSTRGGLRVDASGRVLSAASGAPIPGLYASGNCSNASATGAYCGPGATLGPAMTFGFIIGRQIAETLKARARQPLHR
jgi:3-oxosteroid 1-dehydrogenase